MKYILILLFFCSCGTRKTETTKTDNIIIENNYSQGSKIVLGNAFIYRPFDNSKPMVIEGKVYNNAIVSNDKSIIKTNWKTKYINTTITRYRTKATTRKNNDFLYLGIILIVVIGILGWFKLPSFKS